MVSLQRISRLIRTLLKRSLHTGPSAELEAYDGFSDSQEEEMTEEQHGPPRNLTSLLPLNSPHDRPTAQMIDGLEQVRNILGDQEHSGFSDQSIKDALWEFFFDVDKSVVWLLGESYPCIQAMSVDIPRAEEKQKREAAKDRKGEFRSYNCLHFLRPSPRSVFGCVWASAMLSD